MSTMAVSIIGIFICIYKIIPTINYSIFKYGMFLIYSTIYYSNSYRVIKILFF